MLNLGLYFRQEISHVVLWAPGGPACTWSLHYLINIEARTFSVHPQKCQGASGNGGVSSQKRHLSEMLLQSHQSDAAKTPAVVSVLCFWGKGRGEEKGLPDAILKAAFLCPVLPDMQGSRPYFNVGDAHADRPRCHPGKEAQVLQHPRSPRIKHSGWRSMSEEVQTHCGCHRSLTWGTRSNHCSRASEG